MLFSCILITNMNLLWNAYTKVKSLPLRRQYSCAFHLYQVHQSFPRIRPRVWWFHDIFGMSCRHHAGWYTWNQTDIGKCFQIILARIPTVNQTSKSVFKSCWLVYLGSNRPCSTSYWPVYQGSNTHYEMFSDHAGSYPTDQTDTAKCFSTVNASNFLVLKTKCWPLFRPIVLQLGSGRINIGAHVFISIAMDNYAEDGSMEPFTKMQYDLVFFKNRY